MLAIPEDLDELNFRFNKVTWRIECDDPDIWIKRIPAHCAEYRFLLNIHDASKIFCCDLEHKKNGKHFEFYWSIRTIGGHPNYKTDGIKGPEDIVQAARVLKRALFFTD